MSMPSQVLAPSHADVLEGLRRVVYRQVVRYRHEPLFDVLHQLGFVDWVRQPVPLSQRPVSARSPHHPAPVEIAVLNDTGRAALDRLSGLEQSPRWADLQGAPYGGSGTA